MEGMSKGFHIPILCLFLGPTGTESAKSLETLGNESISLSRALDSRSNQFIFASSDGAIARVAKHSAL